MSRLAREHPEDDRYQSLEGQREVLADLADSEELRPFCPECGRKGFLQYGRSLTVEELCERCKRNAA